MTIAVNEPQFKNELFHILHIIIYFVGIARTTEMPNRRTVVKMWQNEGFIKLQ